ncbi:MAG: hypothetical protein IJA75_00135 [Oscillospiraceae bacterium]|nr:hypothetical protein [Oscillospiraceae bacterium]
MIRTFTGGMSVPPSGKYYSEKSSDSYLEKSIALGFEGIRLQGSYLNFLQESSTVLTPRLAHSTCPSSSFAPKAQ